MNVTMMPVTPGKHDSFETLMTPIFTDFVSKYLEANCHIFLNTTQVFSGNHDKNYKAMHDYSDVLNRLGINYPVSSDSDFDFNCFIDGVIFKLFQAKIIGTEDINMLCCPCGKVDIPSIVVIAHSFSQFSRLINFDNKLTCRSCNQPLNQNNRKVLRLFLQNRDELQVPKTYPLVWRNEVEHVFQKIINQNQIISRHFRSGQTVKLNDQDWVIDTDFRWQCMIEYLFPLSDEIILVSGIDTMHKAIKVAFMAQLFRPNRKIKLIFHPLLNIKDRDKIKYSSISELHVGDWNPIVARLFFAQGIQALTRFTNLSNNDWLLAEKSTILVPLADNHPVIVGRTIDDFFEDLNRQQVLKLMKEIRRRCLTLVESHFIAYKTIYGMSPH